MTIGDESEEETLYHILLSDNDTADFTLNLGELLGECIDFGLKAF